VAYETDEQQAEALKKWWAENGKQVILGAVIGLAVVFGWRAWQEHLTQVNASAAEALDRMGQIQAQGERDQALAQGRKIIDEYASTIYADFASLSMAAILVSRGDEQGAVEHLQRVIDKHRDANLVDLARLRLARVLLSLKRGEEASRLLDQVTNKGYLGEVEAIRGDLALAKGDPTAARAAYEKALASGLADQQLLQLRLDNLTSSANP
jgi:predicted negative regulator of RcsB-dependent stress response